MKDLARSLQQLHQLEYLDLGNYASFYFEEKSPEESQKLLRPIAKLTRLKFLGLQGNELGDPAIPELVAALLQLPALEGLDLPDNGFSGGNGEEGLKLFQAIGSRARLKTLVIGGSHGTNAFDPLQAETLGAELANLSELKTLAAQRLFEDRPDAETNREAARRFRKGRFKRGPGDLTLHDDLTPPHSKVFLLPRLQSRSRHAR